MRFCITGDQLSRKVLGTVLKALYLTGIAGITVCFSIRDSKSNLIRETVIEAGSNVKIESFFRKVPDDAEFITDLSSIDFNTPAVYKIKLHHDILFDDTVTLRIEDTTAPTAEGLTKTVLSYGELPEAKDMVENAYDLSGISSIEYENKPDITGGGTIKAPIRVTDNYGNSSVIQATIISTEDTTAPVIRGVKNVTVTQGEQPDLSAGVYATDDISKNVSVKIDASDLDFTLPGKYKIYYTAQDDAGNKATAEATVTVEKKAETPVKKVAKKKAAPVKKKPDYSKVNQLAAKLLKKLKKGSDVETARAIFKWVHKNITYVHDGSKMTGKKAAYYGLTRRTGNCRVYAWTCKILLDKAGIKNMIVQRYPVTTRHYWNLVYMNGGWYHCDATPFLDHHGIYFKLTDAQLDKHHKFKKSKYPARATS